MSKIYSGVDLLNLRLPVAQNISSMVKVYDFPVPGGDKQRDKYLNNQNNIISNKLQAMRSQIISALES